MTETRGFGPTRPLLRLEDAEGPFDQQWIIPDNRVLDRCSPELWENGAEGQIHIVEKYSGRLGDGLATQFTVLMPDMDHFAGWVVAG
ncbi:type ISP restriction/modification enzyme [Streptomyces sp. NPDC001315]|uniref:type ISP restriction/modification enzyme n=1 Tax=Streptomyces sp. NPDC001315 TaxID=3364562 RepID=UPI003677CD24